MEKVQAMAEQVEMKAKVVQTEVKALVLRHKKALEERECELLWKVSGHADKHSPLLLPLARWQTTRSSAETHENAPGGKQSNVDWQHRCLRHVADTKSCL